MSDPIKHECGIALLRLKKPLQFYLDKYGTALYGLNKMYLLMEKQHNRGQDGAGLANIKFDVAPGTRYISRYRSVKSQPIKDIFSYINKRFEILHKNDPEKLIDVDYLKSHEAFTGELFLGHLRYGTFGGNKVENCHPFLRQNNWMTRNLVVAGNFNLTNVEELFDILVNIGQHPKAVSDAVTIIEKIGHFLDQENTKLFREYINKEIDNIEISNLIAENLNIQKIISNASKGAHPPDEIYERVFLGGSSKDLEDLFKATRNYDEYLKSVGKEPVTEKRLKGQLKRKFFDDAIYKATDGETQSINYTTFARQFFNFDKDLMNNGKIDVLFKNSLGAGSGQLVRDTIRNLNRIQPNLSPAKLRDLVEEFTGTNVGLDANNQGKSFIRGLTALAKESEKVAKFRANRALSDLPEKGIEATTDTIFRPGNASIINTVSYTHLTLPTTPYV